MDDAVVERRMMDAAWEAYESTPIDMCADSDDETRKCVEAAVRAALSVPAEPVAWAYEFHEFGSVWARHVILNRPDGGANPPTKHHGSEIRNVQALYAAPLSGAGVDDLRAENERLRETLNYLAKWVERGLFDQQIGASNALRTIAHFPSMPWKNGRWDVDHKAYAKAFYEAFPRAQKDQGHE